MRGPDASTGRPRAIALLVVGGSLLAIAAIGFVMKWFETPTVLAIGALGLAIDSAGSWLLATSFRREARERRSPGAGP